jgi:UDP-N-acetylglucosamine pyrophosphorylase
MFALLMYNKYRMSSDLPILDKNNNICLYYLRANHYLVSKNNDLPVDVLWKKVFHADIDYQNRHIKFNNEKDKFLFLLQWS